MTADAADKSGIAGAIRSILDSGQQVREQVARVVTDTIGADSFSVEDLGKAARQVMTSTFETINRQVANAVPRDQDSALRDVVYGISDAFGVAAHTAAKALDQATSHGRTFAAEDIKRMTVELGNLASTLVDSVTTTGGSAIDHGAAVARSTVELANAAAQEMKPAVENALRAAALHPVDLALDTVKAGADVSRQMAGSLFTVFGDLLHRAGDAMQSAASATARCKTGSDTAASAATAPGGAPPAGAPPSGAPPSGAPPSGAPPAGAPPGNAPPAGDRRTAD